WRTGLLFRILPYALWVFGRRLLPGAGRSKQIMAPGGGLDVNAIPGPLIPYDRMYANRKAESSSNRGQNAVLFLLQIVAVVCTFFFIWWLHRQNDGLWFQGDSPRHAANGLFWADLGAARTWKWREFALRYYARYPVINPIAYPPLFYLLEAM